MKLTESESSLKQQISGLEKEKTAMEVDKQALTREVNDLQELLKTKVKTIN